MPKRNPSMSPSPAKRRRISGEDEDDAQQGATPHERPRNHAVYGQKSAFPGLDVGGGDDELFYGPAEDGLEYLRMVRSEANALPSLFVARAQTANTTADPTQNTQDDRTASGVHHPPLPARLTGFFADEAYIAPTVLADDLDTDAAVQHTSEPPGAYPDAQISYYNLLRHRFLLLRSTLKCTPPAPAIAALSDTHPISLPANTGAARKEWRHLLLVVDPQMVQLACMDQESVLGVLGIMARLMSQNVRSGSSEQVRRFGAWAWGLLGKCRDVGQQATEEVGEIRDLGKRAVKILQKIREAEVSRAVGDDPDGSDSESVEDIRPHETADAGMDLEPDDALPETTEGRGFDLPDAPPEHTDALEAAKARLQAQLQDQVDRVELGGGPAGADDEQDATDQTRAMLDMIITVVGEFYGQRDLLNAREIWVGS